MNDVNKISCQDNVTCSSMVPAIHFIHFLVVCCHFIILLLFHRLATFSKHELWRVSNVYSVVSLQ